jgi:hypothetical protein
MCVCVCFPNKKTLTSLNAFDTHAHKSLPCVLVGIEETLELQYVLRKRLAAHRDIGLHTHTHTHTHKHVKKHLLAANLVYV